MAFGGETEFDLHGIENARCPHRAVGPDQRGDPCRSAHLRSHARHADLGQVLDLKAYLFRVALNLLSDHQRASAQHASAMQDVAGPYADLVETRTPEAQAMAGEELELIATALRALSPLCQRVFWLNRIYGHKHRDIAACLRISRRTVEANLKRALEHLVSVSIGIDAFGRPSASMW